jgi:hypothetical protein
LFWHLQLPHMRSCWFSLLFSSLWRALWDYLVFDPLSQSNKSPLIIMYSIGSIPLENTD